MTQAKPSSSVGQIASISLRVEHVRETFGIGQEMARLSWFVETEIQGWYQAGYEIEEYDSNGNMINRTSRVESDQSVLVDWPFTPLQSRERVGLRVRVWGRDGSNLPGARRSFLRLACFNLMIGVQFLSPLPGRRIQPSQTPRPIYAATLSCVPGSGLPACTSARLVLYEAEINGKVVGDQVFTPGWTVYDQHLRYQTFDVTGMLHEGPNALGAVLGDGWFRGRIGFGGGQRNVFGTKLALLAQLEVQYEDGSRERIVTDESWRAATGPILLSSIYDGEIYDARLEHPGWSSTGFDDSKWAVVRKLEWNMDALAAPLGPPVRRIETIAPVSIIQSPSGKTIVDFGQNLVGRLSIKVKGPAGHTVTLRHAEVLEHGELATRPLRFAEATDRYTLRGGDIEIWEPRFTFHGFRYVEVNDWPGELKLEDLTQLSSIQIWSARAGLNAPIRC